MQSFIKCKQTKNVLYVFFYSAFLISLEYIVIKNSQEYFPSSLSTFNHSPFFCCVENVFSRRKNRKSSYRPHLIRLVCTYTHTHAHLYICVCACVCVCMYVCMYVYVPCRQEDTHKDRKTSLPMQIMIRIVLNFSVFANKK